MFFRNSGSVVSSLSSSHLRLIWITDLSTCHTQVSGQWPFDVRGPITPPSQHIYVAFCWTRTLWRGLWLSCTCTGQKLHHLFLISNRVSLHSSCLTPPASLFHKYPAPYLPWGRLETFLLFSCLAVLWTNPFSAISLSVSVFGLLHNGQRNLIRQQLGLSTGEDEKDSLTLCVGRRLGDKLAGLRHSLATWKPCLILEFHISKYIKDCSRCSLLKFPELLPHKCVFCHRWALKQVCRLLFCFHFTLLLRSLL